jgi:hypothetical protein
MANEKNEGDRIVHDRRDRSKKTYLKNSPLPHNEKPGLGWRQTGLLETADF